ncbi:MAG: DNA helicase, partial [Candidatus Poribacteria bacterium]|nr:DNA helicase [Candidatus Poribacteria bacterium]
MKPTHKPVRAYYESLDRFHALGVSHEGAVRSAFQGLLESCCRQFNWTLVPEWQMKRARNRRIILDGALIDAYQIPHGYWEAKDIHDDLEREILKKFSDGYPRDNILFQTPQRAILWQNDRRMLDADLSEPDQLIETLDTFFSHQQENIAEWEKAVEAFKDNVKGIGEGLVKIIEEERRTNTRFISAFADFTEKCR